MCFPKRKTIVDVQLQHLSLAKIAKKNAFINIS